MGMTLADLRSEVWDNLGMDSTDISQTKIDQYLNRSYWELTKKLKFRQTDAQFTFSTTIGQTNYPYTNFVADWDAIRHVSIQDFPLQGNEAWREIVQTAYENLMDTEEDVNTSEAIPTRYARFNNEIVFNYVPANVYSIKVFYRKSLGDIAIGGPDCPEEWHEAISYGAIARAWRGKGSPSRSDQASAYQYQLISTMVETETKEDRDYSRSAGRMVRARYP